MRLTDKQHEAQRLRADAQTKRNDASRLQQNEMKRYMDAGDDAGVQNVQHDIDNLIKEAERLETLAFHTDNDARKLQGEIDELQRTIESHRTHLTAYEDQARVAQGHIDSIQREITNLNARIQSLS